MPNDDLPPDQVTWKNAYNATVENTRRAEAKVRELAAEIEQLRESIRALIDSDPVRYKRLRALLPDHIFTGAEGEACEICDRSEDDPRHVSVELIVEYDDG